jgi:neutral ceramidase
MASLMAGFAREAITPPAGVHMMGYASRTEAAIGAHDALFVSAVALSDGGPPVMVLALDMASLDLNEVGELKGRIQALAGVAPERVLVNTSHTHAGPMVARRPGLAYEASYVEAMLAQAARAAAAAAGDLAPATLSVGAAPVDIGLNRRERNADGQIILGVNPEGPRLAETTVWRLSRASAGDIVLFTIPVHGTTLGPENLLFSSEWMGVATRDLEANDPDILAVFLQGCAGDQNPYREQRSFEQVDAHGRAAATAVRAALAVARRIEGMPLRNVAVEANLPLEDGETAVCPIHGLRLGEALLLGLGGEPFVEYALYVRQRTRAESTMVLGYTDGTVGYLPTGSAFAEGGYEVTANRYYAVGKPWAPRVERVLKSEIDAVLDRLAAD